MSLYNISVYDLNFNEVKMSDYKGKILLIVNTATQCGLTPQYVKLQELYNKYKDRNFLILDFPCNQFLNQANKSEEEIKSFCETRFNVTFLQFAKVDVNGKNASELFKFLKNEKSGFVTPDIKWNFTKFLVDRNGEVIKRFSPFESFEKIESEIIKLL